MVSLMRRIRNTIFVFPTGRSDNLSKGYSFNMPNYHNSVPRDRKQAISDWIFLTSCDTRTSGFPRICVSNEAVRLVFTETTL